jgi:hypothetical protein
MARRSMVLMVLVATAALAVTVEATPGPGPGAPFGGNDTGCVPASQPTRACADKVAKAFSTLVGAVSKCHARQADGRVKEMTGQIRVFDEPACKAAARARFEKVLAGLAAGGSCAGSTTLSASAALEMDLLADASDSSSLDARNGDAYCDPTSEIAIDPTGAVAGTVPATEDNLTCGDRVAKNAATLVKNALRCHTKAADDGFRLFDPPFDEDACEATALAKFDQGGARLIAKGSCPSCLDAGMQHTLATAWRERLAADNASIYPCEDDVLHPGTPHLDPPTLMALGVQLPIAGDNNHNAAVAVRYRVVGDPTWRDAQPLFRVHPEAVVGRIVPEQFAGSLLDLRPATAYEIELHATDTDGPVDQVLTLTATTRSVPGDPVAPHPVAVSDTASLTAALAAAAPGDVITLAAGVYAGPFVLEASGTPTNPIVVRGTSTDAAILDGGDCASCNVLEVYGSYVHVERLTLRHANRALRFQTAGAVANVVRRVHALDTTLGFASREDQRDFYICDNILEGRLVWPHVYFDDGGAHSNDDGIAVEGNGHVVCHNQVVGFGDALKNLQEGARALDFYGNEVLSAYDNGIELDLTEGNVRCLRNRFTNTFATLSYQPTYGGPSYTVRNVIVNVGFEQLKMQGVGGGTGPNGVFIYHNTFVSPSIALLLDDSVTSHHFDIENNLFVGPAMLAGTRTVDWLGAIDDGRFDYNGYFPDGGFRFNLPPAGLVGYASFADMHAAGTFEPNGLLLAAPIFANGLTAPADYTVTLAAQDTTLAPVSNAIDGGRALAGINDGFVGAAPDLGALERGCPLPIFGVRPEGTDETNEPLGCAP